MTVRLAVCPVTHMAVSSSHYSPSSLSSLHSSSCVATVRCSLYLLRSRSGRHEGTHLSHTHTHIPITRWRERRPTSGGRSQGSSLVDVSAEWPECSKCRGRDIGRKKA